MDEDRDGTNDESLAINGEEYSVKLAIEYDRALKHPGRIDKDAQICIDFEDVSVSVPICKVRRKGGEKSREILHGVSGCFRPARLTVIIGPSGAGKTTLLSIVSGLRKSGFKGTVRTNGGRMNPLAFRRRTSFIPQEFTLLPVLTTRETIYIAARLKLSCDSAAANSISEEIAECLSLVTCMNTLVSNLSGGEKKRLSIGIEIVTNPSVMFLDEPTSGLDSIASIQVIALLHSMARAGCTVVCAVHQPSSRMIEFFDDVIVVAEGRQFYCGPRDGILDAFSAAGYTCPQFYNIADFVLEVVTGQRDGDLSNLYEIGVERYAKIRSQYCTSMSELTAPALDDKYSTNKKTISGKQQLSVLFYRALIGIKRDNTMTRLRLCAHIAVATLLGMVYYDFGNDAHKVMSNVSCIYFLLLFVFFANAMPAVQMFPTEAAVFLREYSNNWYPLKLYYVVKVASDLFLQIVCPSIFLSIVYYMTGQPLESNMFIHCWVICVVFTILGQSVGIATGAAFNTDLGMFLIPTFCIPMMIFAGFFLKLDEVQSYLQPLSTISFFRYAFEGMLQAIYSTDRPLKCTADICIFNTSAQIMRTLSMPTVSFATIIIALNVWIVALHAFTFSILWWRLRSKFK